MKKKKLNYGNSSSDASFCGFWTLNFNKNHNNLYGEAVRPARTRRRSNLGGIVFFAHSQQLFFNAGQSSDMKKIFVVEFPFSSVFFAHSNRSKPKDFFSGESKRLNSERQLHRSRHFWDHANVRLLITAYVTHITSSQLVDSWRGAFFVCFVLLVPICYSRYRNRMWKKMCELALMGRVKEWQRRRCSRDTGECKSLESGHQTEWEMSWKSSEAS